MSAFFNVDTAVDMCAHVINTYRSAVRVYECRNPHKNYETFIYKLPAIFRGLKVKKTRLLQKTTSYSLWVIV